MRLKLMSLLFAASNLVVPNISAEVQSLAGQEIVEGSYIILLEPQPAVMARGSRNIEDIALSLISEAQQTESGAYQRTIEKRDIEARQSLSTVYEKVLEGFSANLTEEEASRLSKLAGVKAVYPDVYFYGDNDIPLGIDRVDQRYLPLDDLFNANSTGKGVSIYVIDSGIDFDHPEFNGRAFSAYDFVDDDGNASDCHGHGTHVAGTAAGKTVGLAPDADIYSVKILDCNNKTTGALSLDAVEWVMENASKPAVVNYSIGNSSFPPLDVAVQNLVTQQNIQFANSAGNNGKDACIPSPKAPAAITVGSTDSSDYRSNGSWASNYGDCVDIFAPGSNIKSARNGGGYTYMGGTSMATPLVAGAVALYLEKHPHAMASEVKQALLSDATQGVLKDIGAGSPNRLLYVNYDAGPQQGAPDAVASASVSEVIGAGTVSLVGNQSTDPDGDALTYLWQQVSPISPVANIEVASSQNTFVHFDSTTEPVNYRFSLQVSDGELNDTDEVAILHSPDSGSQSAPIAVATASATELVGEGNITLSAHQSSDADGDPLSYHWQQVSPSTPQAVIVNANSIDTLVQFSSTQEPIDYVFGLVVSDGSLNDSVELSISHLPESSGNLCPSWEPNKIYYGGEVVRWADELWEAHWWTQNNEPGSTGNEWDVWRIAVDPDCE
ncbi:hypothetical protein C9I98_00655 [Photobacterium sanctipauli]|uniref:Chitin-binding type-3 domain-containing protein n=1 Tax=Photobacterium sanctipauli TaxID=1342794 RepID=A0A2T3NZV8_9GAMM|nr:S8 family serine peptidase [Photobacterium sanctipauli]PSW21811.1 hypothetical protein C9I98_00655 [Photobacterium sanctipauli]